MVLFILFPPLGASKNIWSNDHMKGTNTDFLQRLEEIGSVFYYTPIFTCCDKVFNLEDILFENHCEWVYNQVKDTSDKLIAIGLEEGCHYANYFANKYKCYSLFLIGNRRFNRENYLKSVERGARMMEKEYGEGYEQLIGNINNDNLHMLLHQLSISNDKKYLIMIDYYVGITLRKQYNDIPKKMVVPTYIYNRITLSRQTAIHHNLKDNTTKYIKNIQSENEAIWAHCITNMDKYEADQELIKNSAPGIVHCYYIANEDFSLFIYGSAKNDILEKIENVVIEQNGGYS